MSRILRIEPGRPATKKEGFFFEICEKSRTRKCYIFRTTYCGEREVIQQRLTAIGGCLKLPEESCKQTIKNGVKFKEKTCVAMSTKVSDFWENPEQKVVVPGKPIAYGELKPNWAVRIWTEDGHGSYSYCAEGASFSATRYFQELVSVCLSTRDRFEWFLRGVYAPASPSFPARVGSTWNFRDPGNSWKNWEVTIRGLIQPDPVFEVFLSLFF